MEQIKPSLSFMKQLLIILISTGVLGVGTGGFTYLGNRTGDSLFTTVTLERGTIDRVVTATGTLNPVATVKVGTQVSGTIKQLFADYNSIVKKDQLLAILDPATFEAQVSKAKAGLESAERNLDKGKADVDNAKINLQNSLAKLAQDKANQVKTEASLLSEQASLERAKIMAQDAKVKLDRTLRLVKEGILAASEGDTAQANYDAAVASTKAAEGQVRAAQAQVEAAKAQVQAGETQVNSARSQVESSQINIKFLSAKLEEAKAELALTQVNLDRTIIRAPINGIVVSREVDLGQTVAASLQSPTLFSLAGDLSKMQVDVSTDEADVGNIALGQPATFTVDSYPGERFQGQVTEIRLAPIISQNVVTYNTIVKADNPELKMKPGMTANVSILVLRKENVLRLPNAALRFVPPDAAKLLKEFGDGVPARQPEQAGAPGPGAGEAPAMRGEQRPPGAPGEGLPPRARGEGRPPSMRGEGPPAPEGQMGRPPGPGAMRGEGRPPGARGEGEPPGMRGSGGPPWAQGRGPTGMKKGVPRGQRVWVLGENKKPKPVLVILGTSDGTFTEVVGGDLKDGQQVIVRMASKENAPTSSGQPGLPRGFGPMGRF